MAVLLGRLTKGGGCNKINLLYIYIVFYIYMDIHLPPFLKLFIFIWCNILHLNIRSLYINISHMDSHTFSQPHMVINLHP